MDFKIKKNSLNFAYHGGLDLRISIYFIIYLLDDK